MTTLAEQVAEGFTKLVELNDTRELGKFLAFTTERVIAPNYLASIGIQTTPAPDDADGQQERYDLLSDRGLRIQVKFRGGKTLHMEQTRRTTGKNAGRGAKNGQVRYAVGDYDVALFVIPRGYANTEDWQFLAIPAHELEDRNLPGFCVGSVPAAVRRRYEGKAKEVLQAMNLV